MSETKTDEELAREWMASEHWGGWRVGMVDNEGAVVTEAYDCGLVDIVGEGRNPHDNFDTRCMGLPDLSHPGTRAFLLEDVRKAWGEPGMSAGGWCSDVEIELNDDGTAVDEHKRWFVCDGSGDFIYGPTESHALMAALRAAPGEEARRG